MNVYEDVNRANSFIPFIIIGLGVVGNSLSFLIFRFNSEFKKMSSMVFLSFLVVMDTMSLFVWNINRYTVPYLGIDVESTSMFTCKFLSFIQYYSLEASGVLLSFMTIDRFVAVRSMPGSFYTRLPFNSVKSAFYWSITIVLFLGILNIHILILNGYYEDPVLRNRTVYNVIQNDGTVLNETTEQYLYQNPNIVCYLYKNGFRLFPTWDSVHMFFYSFIPSTIMVIFNVMLIRTTLMPEKKDTNRESQKANAKKRKLTISLLAITFAFILMTLPATIAWGYMSWVLALPWGRFTLNILGYFLFLNHASVFFNCLLCNYKFRSAVKMFVKKNVFHQR
jgi:hypothetical protein